jgi:hypothetical protein
MHNYEGLLITENSIGEEFPVVGMDHNNELGDEFARREYS